ncbi:DNA-binding transcriptional LysR family regulator [Micromonospora sp. Llam0]|uniref:LysR family transcriptional regulator n=1 Tax=Micromonospora sp. Llam0 TaxID=2485143 RepID=UPI000F4AE78D|nr:LysR family transcriptional regulator [Micromonospora sp. Llam0]ROO50973.1 DNA-binding transcriptional LysR family regulator [Micromonospora sp. Llam0]
MSIGVSHLRALVAVVDAGGFGAAATRLGISQSAVSHAIASLERITGRPVLTRSGIPSPTRLGERILEHARAAVTAVAAVEQLAHQRDDQVAGRLVLAAPPTVCHGLVPTLLNRWRVEFPDVRVTLFEGDDDEVDGWLEQATVDLAVLVDPAARHDDGVQLGADSFYAVLRADHPLANQPKIDLLDLSDDDFLLSAGGCERQLRMLYWRAGVPLTPAHRVRQLSTLFAMIRAGVGVSVVPGLADGMQGDGVLMVPLTVTLQRTLVLSGPQNRPWHPAASALVTSASVVAASTVPELVGVAGR